MMKIPGVQPPWHESLQPVPMSSFLHTHEVYRLNIWGAHPVQAHHRHFFFFLSFLRGGGEASPKNILGRGFERECKTSYRHLTAKFKKKKKKNLGRELEKGR